MTCCISKGRTWMLMVDNGGLNFCPVSVAGRFIHAPMSYSTVPGRQMMLQYSSAYTHSSPIARARNTWYERMQPFPGGN